MGPGLSGSKERLTELSVINRSLLYLNDRPQFNLCNFQASGIIENFRTVSSNLDFNLNPNKWTFLEETEEVFLDKAMPIFASLLFFAYSCITVVFMDEKVNLIGRIKRVAGIYKSNLTSTSTTVIQYINRDMKAHKAIYASSLISLGVTGLCGVTSLIAISAPDADNFKEHAFG